MADDENKGDSKEESKKDEEEQQQDEAAAEEESRKKRLERGDYVIQVHVIEARDLKPRDFGDTSDPVAEVTVMNVKKSTQIHKESLTVMFDERLTYDFKNLEPEELNQGKCIIEVFDANVIRKNVLIGSFEFDLTMVYYKQHHELYQQWVALTDVTGDNEGVQGYLQVTIVVLGPKDEQFIHPESEEFETEGALLNVMMPPQVETDPHLLRVFVRQLDKLMVMDRLGLRPSSDPYAIVKFGGHEVRTSTFWEKLDVMVHECVTLPVMEPLLGDTIILHVKDADKTSKDEIIGTFTYSYNAIKKSGMRDQWVHMYGAPSGKQKGLADKMNRAIVEGTTYRGSMMLSMVVDDKPSDDELKSQCMKAGFDADKLAPGIEQWALQVDVYQGVEVGDGKGKFAIRMMIRDLKVQTDFSPCAKGACEWYELMKLSDAGAKEDTIDLRMPDDVNQCPDVIFYLIEKKSGFDTTDNVISYLRFKWKDLVGKNYKKEGGGFSSPPQWYQFKPSEVLQKLDEETFPGTILMGIRAGLQAKKPKDGVPPSARPFLNMADESDPLMDIYEEHKNEEASISSSKTKTIVTSVSMSGGDSALDPLLSTPRAQKRSVSSGKLTAAETMGKLDVTVVNAQNVPPMDRDGTSDPYVEVTVNGHSQKTSVQKGSLKPSWNEKFEYPGVSIHDSISLQLNDWNRFGKKDVIGKVDNIILMGLLKEAKGQLGVDFNYTKKFFVSEKFPNCTVTISITFDFDAKQVAMRREKKSTIGIFDKVTKESKSKRVDHIMGRPYPRNYKMIVYVYQARNLDALDDSGFSDPFIEVTYCGKRAKSTTIKKTLNPQWMEQVTLNVDVPQPASYAPAIRCSVYDWDRFSGNDLIGRLFVPFMDVLSMMRERKPRWYYLRDLKGEQKEGKVYLAIEFIDANVKADPIFKIDKSANPFYLHLLTIGVRSMKSALGVHKPQVVYTAPLAGSVEEIATDPSSNPNAANANFLVIQKLPIKIPIDYELAPVINIIVRDNLFGGLVKRSIGSSIIDLHDFMVPIKSSEKNEWRIKDNRIEILNEKQLKLEIAAEDRAERREYKAEARMNLLSIKKAVELAEARCQNRAFNKKELMVIEDIGKNAVEIEDSEDYRARLFAEEDAYQREKEEEEERLAEQQRQRREAEKRKKEIEKKADKDDGKEEEKGEAVDGKEEEEEEKDGVVKKKKKKRKKKKKKAAAAAADTDTTGRQRAESETASENGDEDEEEDESSGDSDDSSSSSDDDEEEKEDIPAEDVPKEKEDKKVSKKKAEKKKRKNEERALKDWDKEDEDQCFDLDSKVTVNPEDFEPEYLKGRPRIHDELEDEYACNPFETIQLWTGQKGSIFGGRRVTGAIKGLWKLSESGDNPFGNGLKSLIQTRTISVRLYILNGMNLMSTDRDNSSDPYLVVKLGKEKFSTRKRYIPNTLQPQFHEPFEFHTTLPGPSHITVEIWDWDGIGDDLVGRTVIDIEDRWFSKVWRRLKVRPLEERTLRNPRSAASFGKLRMWIDLYTKDEARNIPLVDISLPPKQHYEFRLIMWKAKDVVIKDELTDQNDLRVTVKVTVDEKLKQETDTHWRAKFGKGSWNWRCIFNLQLPFQKKTLLHLSMWDQDVFSASDSIGEINFSLDLLLRHAYLKKDEIPRIILRKDQEKRFWLNMMHTKWPGEVQGKLQVSMELMTSEEAVKFPAGLGRGDPNMNPYLPEPEGRFRFSLNPFAMLKQLLGDKLFYKLCGGICCIACLAIAIFFGPQLFITFMSNLIVGQ
eukprot:CAMPEP_0202695866 /NCGR_PEP_ID=MMETSP1385-20130828/9321_1 /ASSEMBLY_ACC=CAM_ASM_000861 /TAXON_ID=933848 /ORGANISM="Elphidium margaritaceum" /LENGTH=1764 /DNA_ID=CAMNT_0049351945 /DNA_START=35 /DNA_END=5329 /DNA_ORIENTATION=-